MKVNKVSQALKLLKKENFTEKDFENAILKLETFDKELKSQKDFEKEVNAKDDEIADLHKALSNLTEDLLTNYAGVAMQGMLHAHLVSTEEDSLKVSAKDAVRIAKALIKEVKQA